MMKCHTTNNPWHSAKSQLCRYRLPSHLLDGSSMTSRLRKHYQHFEVITLKNGYAQPTYHDASALKIHQPQPIWLRETLLLTDNTPYVLARTLCHAHDASTLHTLKHLNNKPLGAMLFKHNTWQRSEFEIARNNSTNWKLAESSPLLSTMQGEYWARRSLFTKRDNHSASILVSEIFLQDD